jgi:hypothetical protein
MGWVGFRFVLFGFGFGWLVGCLRALLLDCFAGWLVGCLVG